MKIQPKETINDNDLFICIITGKELKKCDYNIYSENEINVYGSKMFSKYNKEF